MAREFFTDIDLNQNEMQFMVMHPLATAPSGGTEVEGQMYYDTVAQQPFFWNGSSWTSMSSGAASNVPFSGITGGTNASATMLVGGGASLSFVGLGTINANVLDGRTVDAPAAQDGEFLIFTGGSVNAWQARKILASDFPELELNDLVDVDINAASDGDLLQYIGGSINAWGPIPASAISADLGDAVILDPTSDTRNVISNTDGSAHTLLTLEAGNAGTYDLFVVNDSSSAELFTIDSAGDTVIRGTIQGGGSAGTSDSTGFILDNSGLGGGPRTFTFPNGSGEIVTVNSSQDITGQKTFDSGDLRLEATIAGQGWAFSATKSSGGFDTLFIPQPTSDVDVTMLITEDTSTTAGNFAIAVNATEGLVTFRDIQNSDIADILALGDLTDVDYSGGGPSDGNLLVYLGGSVDAWVHRSPESILTDLPYLKGSGTANQVAYWDGTDSLTGESEFTYDGSTNALTVTSGNVNASRFVSGGGALGTPAFTFSTDTDSGLYQIGADALGLSAGGIAAITATEAASAIVIELRDEVRISDGTNYVGFSLPALGGDTDYTLPDSAASSNNQVLASSTGGALTWVSLSTIDGASSDSLTQYVFNAPTTATRNNVTAQSSTVVPLRLIGASGQSANLFEIENDSNIDLFIVDASGNVTITGDLTINGTTTTVDTTNLIVEDNFIVVNSAGVVQDAGIEVERGGAGSGDNAFLRFNESNNEWYVDNGTVSHLMARKYVEEITGDDSTTTFNILHDMGSLYVLVQVFDSSTGKQVEIDVDVFSSDRVDLNFKTAPAGGQSYRVIVVG